MHRFSDGFTRNGLAFTPPKCPLRRANPWVQDLCKHLFLFDEAATVLQQYETVLVSKYTLRICLASSPVKDRGRKPQGRSYLRSYLEDTCSATSDRHALVWAPSSHCWHVPLAGGMFTGVSGNDVTHPVAFLEVH